MASHIFSVNELFGRNIASEILMQYKTAKKRQEVIAIILNIYELDSKN